MGSWASAMVTKVPTLVVWVSTMAAKIGTIVAGSRSSLHEHQQWYDGPTTDVSYCFPIMVAKTLTMVVSAPIMVVRVPNMFARVSTMAGRV